MSALKVFLKSVLIFFTTFLTIFIVQALLAFLALAITQDTASSEQLFIEQLYAILVSLILIVWTKKKKPTLYKKILDSINLSSDNLLALAKFIFLSLIVLYFVFGVSGLLDQYEFIQWGIKEYSIFTITKRIILIGLLGNIIVAFGEEIIFRGFLMDYLAEISESNIFGLLFTAAVFALHPYQDFLNYVIAFTAGLALGYAYLKFRTLYIPVGIHFAYNFFNLTIASDPGRGPQLPYLTKFNYQMIADGFGAWVDLFIILGFLIILLILWSTSNKYF